MMEVLYFFVGLVASLLGSMAGLGGGFLAVPTLYYLGFPISSAVATSKFMVLVNSIVSTYRYSKKIRNPVKLYVAVVVPMIAAAYLGAYLVAVAPRRVLAIVVGGVLLAGSLRMIVEQGEARKAEGKALAGDEFYVLGALSGAASGLVAGLTGLGGGIVNVPVFIYVLGLTSHSAVSLSMACILPAAVASTIRHAVDQLVVWNAALPLGLGAVVGGWIGPRIALKLSREKLRKVIGVILFAAVLRIVVQAVLG